MLFNSSLQITPHLYEVGWLQDHDKMNWDKENSFRTLSPQNTPDGHLKKILIENGVRPDTVKGVISSCDHSVQPMEVQFKENEKLYGFATKVDTATASDSAMGIKGENSVYWTTEAEINKLVAEGKINLEKNEVDSMGIKNHFALPCHNMVNCIVEAKVKVDSTFVETKVGPAEETFERTLPGKEKEQMNRRMDGGGVQIHPNLSNIDRGHNKNFTPFAKELPALNRADSPIAGDLSNMRHNYVNLRTQDKVDVQEAEQKQTAKPNAAVSDHEAFKARNAARVQAGVERNRAQGKTQLPDETKTKIEKAQQAQRRAKAEKARQDQQNVKKILTK